MAILLETGVEGEEVGTITDANGEYAIGPVGAGVYTLSMFKDGYIGSTVTDYEIEGGLDKQFAFALPLRPAEMSDEAYELTGFTVSADEANDMMMKLDLKFNSDRALDIMSAEDFSKFAASDVADAVKRIAGVSVNDGKFPSVRGLNDRYTVTTLNGMPLPSPDPFRKSPQFDMFPSSLLDSIVVSKSATADLAGESTAANFDLITKRLPEERILKFSFGLGVNENAWDDFRKFDRPSSYWYADAADDFDPAPRENYDDPNVRPGYDPTDEFLSKRSSKRPDMSLSGTYGETFEFRNDRRLGVVASGYYKIKRETLSDATRVDDYDFESAEELRPDEDARVINIGQPSYILLDNMGNFAGFVPVASYVPVNGVAPERGVDPLFFGSSVVGLPYGDQTTYDFSAYSESVLMGGLAGLTYEMADDHVVGTNLFHSRTSDTFVGHAVNGINPGENISGTVLGLERETLYYVERSLTAIQLFGEHRLTSSPVFDPLLSWGYQHARANQDEPDFRDTVRVLDQDGNRRNVNSTDNIAYSSRSWRSVDEEEDSFRLDLELDLNEKTGAFIGYARSDADRTSEVQTYIERRTDTFSTGEIV
ncbi:MAG: TonB-dependent receptor plug domain-containing protein, partial [Coraliomargarita sp.]